MLPSDDNGVSLVLETGEMLGLPPLGSLAGIGLSLRSMALMLKHRARRLTVSARRVVSIVVGGICSFRGAFSEMQ